MALSRNDIQDLLNKGSISQSTADLMNTKSDPIDTSVFDERNPYAQNAGSENALASNPAGRNTVMAPEYADILDEKENKVKGSAALNDNQKKTALDYLATNPSDIKLPEPPRAISPSEQIDKDYNDGKITYYQMTQAKKSVNGGGTYQASESERASNLSAPEVPKKLTADDLAISSVQGDIDKVWANPKLSYLQKQEQAKAIEEHAKSQPGALINKAEDSAVPVENKVNRIPETTVTGSSKPGSKGGSGSGNSVPTDSDYHDGSFEEYKKRVAGLDDRGTAIADQAEEGLPTAPGEQMDSVDQLAKDRATVQNKYNYTPQGYFDWKNAQLHPELYSYGRLKSGFVNDQLNYNDEHKAFDKTINEGMAAKANAEKARDDAMAAQYGEQAAQSDQNMLELQNWQNDFNAKTEQLNREKQSAVQQYMNTQVDPNKYYKDLGVGGGIFAAITAGLAGAFLNRAEGKSVDNPVIKGINQNIDRDIDAQKTELAKRRDLVNIKDNDIANFMRQGYSARDSILMAQKIGYQKAENLLNQTAIKYNSPIAQANSQVILAGLQQQQSSIDHQLQNNTAQLVLGQRAPKPVATADDIDPDNIVTLQDGSAVAFRNVEEAKTAREQLSLTNSLNQNLNIMQEYLDKGSAMSVADRAKYNQAMAFVKGHSSEFATRSKRFSEPEAENLTKGLDLGVTGTDALGGAKTSIKAWKKAVADSSNETTAGALPVDNAIVRDKKGGRSLGAKYSNKARVKPIETDDPVE